MQRANAIAATATDQQKTDAAESMQCRQQADDATTKDERS
jgi:hypothetical protein